MKKTFIILLLLIMSITLGGNDININNKLNIKQSVIVEASTKSNHIQTINTIQFIKGIGSLESKNNWKAINKFNYIGEFQLGYSALKDIGYPTKEILRIRNEFRNNPKIFTKKEQYVAAYIWFNKNEKYLKKEIKEFRGKKINGYTITKPAILAAAHLGGYGSVRKYLYSNGKNIKIDGFGTSIEDYIRRMQYYKMNETFKDTLKIEMETI